MNKGKVAALPRGGCPRLSSAALRASRVIPLPPLALASSPGTLAARAGLQGVACNLPNHWGRNGLGSTWGNRHEKAPLLRAGLCLVEPGKVGDLAAVLLAVVLVKLVVGHPLMTIPRGAAAHRLLVLNVADAVGVRGVLVVAVPVVRAAREKLFHRNKPLALASAGIGLAAPN